MKKLLVIPVLLVGSLAGIQQAQSKVCCDPWGWVGYAAFMSAGSAVVTAITASATTVVNGLIMVQQSWSQGFQGWMGEQTTASAQRVQIKEARVTTDATRCWSSPRVRELQQRTRQAWLSNGVISLLVSVRTKLRLMRLCFATRPIVMQLR